MEDATGISELVHAKYLMPLFKELAELWEDVMEGRDPDNLMDDRRMELVDNIMEIRYKESEINKIAKMQGTYV